MTSRKWLFWTAAIGIPLLFLYAIKAILLPFVLGILTAYFLDPSTDRLERMNLSRGMATSVITAAFFITVGLALLLIVPVIAQQLSGLIAALPEVIGDAEKYYGPRFSRWVGHLPAEQMDGVKSAVANFSGTMAKLFADFATGLFQSGMAFLNLLSLILITPVVTFYLLRDWDTLVARIDALLPRPYATTIREQMRIIDATLAGFIHGQVNVCLTLALYYAVTLSMIGLKFGIVIGFATGMLVILPYVGFMFSMTIALAVAFFQFEDSSAIAAVFGIYMIGQVVESYFLTPKLVGEKVGLHPVWIIFGMLAGASLFGFVGVLLAIPATAVIGVLLRFALSHYLQSEYYQPKKIKAARSRKAEE